MCALLTDQSYVDVPVTRDGVATNEFLDATEAVVNLFDLLGSSAFSIVQNDMNGNITVRRSTFSATNANPAQKVRTRLLSTGPDMSGTLEHLVKNEGSPDEKKRTATEGLMWLLRGLQFTLAALRRSLDNPNEELSVSFTKAYETTLSKHHSFVVRPVFSVAMKACPYRKDFYAKLGEPADKVVVQLKAWLDALEKILDRMEHLYVYVTIKHALLTPTQTGELRQGPLAP